MKSCSISHFEKCVCWPGPRSPQVPQSFKKNKNKPSLPFPPPFLISPIHFPMFSSPRLALQSNDQAHGGLAMSLYLLCLLLLLLHLSCCFIGCQFGSDINEHSPLISVTSVAPRPSFYPQGWMHSSKWHSKCPILVVLFCICSSRLWLTWGKRLVEAHSPCRYFISCVTYCLCFIYVFFLNWIKSFF